MRYKVIRNKIIKQVADDYIPVSLPKGFPDEMRETVVDYDDLGILYAEFTIGILVFPDISVKELRYWYINGQITDKTSEIKKEIIQRYHEILTLKVKQYLNSLGLNEESIKRKYLIYLSDPENVNYLGYKTNFDTMNGKIGEFLTDYRGELDIIDGLMV